MNVQNIRHQSDYSYFKSEERKNIDVEEKYSLQGTTQSRYLTGGVPPVRFSM